MKIGIISDTHINGDIDKFKKVLDKYLNEVEMIIHAGDYTDIRVIELLKIHKKFVGVRGNVDNHSIANIVKEKEIISVDPYKIGIFHGHGEEKGTFDRAYDKFKDDNVDIIIFGHSHQPLVKTKNGIIMINPGSITSKRMERWFSYAILEINGEDIDISLKFI